MFKRVNVIVYYDMVMLKSMDPYRLHVPAFFNVSFKENQNSVLQLKFHTTYQVVNITGRMMIIEKNQYISRYVFSWGKK